MNMPTHLSLPPRRIAVFRALQLGDMLCSMPALRVLRQTWPEAKITLVGLPNATSIVKRFDAYIDDLIVFPGIPEFPEQMARVAELPAFFEQARSRDFDLAIQLHGSGGLANDIVERLGARQWVGFVPTAQDTMPGRLMAWPEDLPEPQRYTALLRFIGLSVDSDALEFPLTREDWTQAIELTQRFDFDPTRSVFIHPGARLPSRRWPSDRFAEVGNALAARGWGLVVTGSEEERPLTRALHQALGPGAVDLTGRTSLGSLAALVSVCALLVCNDTGISHVAAATRAPSVVIASGSDVDRWAPLDSRRHRVLSFSTPCRPCSHFVCPIGHPCALGVSAEQVLTTAIHHLGVHGRIGPPK